MPFTACSLLVAAGALPQAVGLPAGTKETATRSPATPGASTTDGASSPWKSVVAVGSLLGCSAAAGQSWLDTRPSACSQQELRSVKALLAGGPAAPVPHQPQALTAWSMPNRLHVGADQAQRCERAAVRSAQHGVPGAARQRTAA